MIDHETQQRIKEAANIVEVVGDYVKLTRRGANYMGLCPFHNERTPSFSVSPRRNFCHCFSCKKGGSPVNFLMEKEGISYTEALMLLAKKYNIPVRERELSDEERARMSEREAMLVASEWAMKIFHENLYETEEGRDIGLAYLYGRGITDEAIKKYRLGYSIDRGDALLSRAQKEGFDIEVLKKIGLVGTSQQGRNYDKFRGRVMFPIRNTSGKPVAFGGRALKGEAAKYINSPETLLYTKSKELYGIYEAKSDILKLDRVFLMEGYLDVIGSWQAGLKNVVASSGTALTESQIALIHRFTNNVTLIYDGDSAGIKASLRGIDMLLAQKLHVKVLLLPDGEDPDSFARKHTPEDFQKYIEENQTDFIRYKLDVLLKEAGGNPQEISQAMSSIVSSIASIPDEIERISYIKESARIVGFDEKVISRQVARTLISKAGEKRYNAPYQDFSTSVTVPKGEPASEKKEEVSGSGELPAYHLHEREILKYCVRYAFLDMTVEDDSIMVIDFIGEEMEADGITFSNGDYQRVFDIIMAKKEDFRKGLDHYTREIDSHLKDDRENFRERIRRKGGSAAKIKNEEEKYLAAEVGKRTELLKQFTINFSVDILINHEDSKVRDIANSLVAEKHTLSSIYTRCGQDDCIEENMLVELVPRALAELRAEILNNKVLELEEKIKEASRAGDSDSLNSLMEQLTRILAMRSRIAEDLGERIISPR